MAAFRPILQGMTEAHPAIPFDNSYARLPGSMHVGVDPTPVSAPRLIRVNEPLARELGINPAALTAEVAVSLACALVLAFAATLYPSWRASRATVEP